MCKLSISEVTTHAWTFEDDVFNYSTAGIQGIGVWRDKLDNFGEDAGLELLKNSPLKTANLVDAGYFLSKTRSQTRRAIEDTVEAIHLCHSLQTDCLLIVTGDIGSFFRSQEQARNIVVEALTELAPIANEAGVRLAIEPINQRYPGYTFVKDIPSTLDIVDAVGADNVGLLFDTDHLYESPNLFDEINIAGDRIFCVHLNDMPAVPGPGIDRKLMGDGVIPLKEILSAIEATGYDGYYDVEIMSDNIWKMDYISLIENIKQRFESLWD
jgi:sugar phosphate isomerase/epimerase